MKQQDNIFKRCEMCAIRMLSRRECSQLELEQKLKLKGYHEATVAKVLLKIRETGLQSDERFASCYTRSRMERGCGPIRIQHELQNRGISREIIEQTIEEYKDDWLDVAKKVRLKKFGDELPTSPLEQAKQKRFLLYRGFDGKQLLVVNGA